MHNSVRLGTPCEFLTATSISPLISKCQIKVCYVGDTPNRNRSIITKDVAIEMGKTLPGSPIVGYFNSSDEDFEEHNRSIDISNGKFEIKDTTKPYGFVPTDAKVWFDKYIDDGNVEHEYLVTEGYLWTGQYPECKRIIEIGNNQSMELDENSLNADWTFDDNGKPEFFIINEAIISKLCILGENVEPCFEGSQITNVQFSFDDGFKQELYSMMNELTNLLNGGEPKMEFTTYAVEIGDSLWNAIYKHLETKYPDNEQWYCSKYTLEGVYEEGTQKFCILKERANGKFYRLNFSLSEEAGFEPAEELEEVTLTFTPAENPQFSVEEVEKFEKNFKKNEDKSDSEDKEKNEDNTEEEEKDSSVEEPSEEDKEEEEEKEEEKKKYSLEEISEYQELLEKFNALEETYNSLLASNEALQQENASLVEFKKNAERIEKKAMIDNFYMLSDEEKANVIENIDNYTIKDIENELSVIYARNSMKQVESEEHKNNQSSVFNMQEFGNISEEDDCPAWIKAVLEKQNNL